MQSTLTVRHVASGDTLATMSVSCNAASTYRLLALAPPASTERRRQSAIEPALFEEIAGAAALPSNKALLVFYHVATRDSVVTLRDADGIALADGLFGARVPIEVDAPASVTMSLANASFAVTVEP